MGSVRELLHCVMVKVLCQHLPGDAEHMADPKPCTMIHQAVIQHAAYEVQLCLRIRCERPVCPIYVHPRILLKPRKTNDHPVTVLDHNEGARVDQPILRRVPDRINSVPLILLRRVHLH